MKIEIFDVEHGQCAMIHCPNGKKLMIDAGHKSNYPEWRPSAHFTGQEIEKLIITNYDEDHTSDLRNLMQHTRIRFMSHNTSINSQTLRQMKAQHGMGPGVQRFHDWLQTVERGTGSGASADLGEVTTQSFWNHYPFFTDANNLSIATFVSYCGFTILFPGDLEIAGWEKLLERADFREALKGVTLLVASHHGRENGCCEEVFDYCSPYAVIISDSGIQHSTQETQGWYANRVRGYKETDGTTRKFLTTRRFGTITIDVNEYGTGIVSTEKRQAAPTVEAFSLSSLFNVDP